VILVLGFAAIAVVALVGGKLALSKTVVRRLDAHLTDLNQIG
jgi:hypothetical protein